MNVLCYIFNVHIILNYYYYLQLRANNWADITEARWRRCFWAVRSCVSVHCSLLLLSLSILDVVRSSMDNSDVTV